MSGTADVSLPKVLCIDEFKGNVETVKCQCILDDDKKSKVLDMRPDSSQSHLISYFKEIPSIQRHSIRFFVFDMWQPYVNPAKAFALVLRLLLNIILSGRLLGL